MTQYSRNKLVKVLRIVTCEVQSTEAKLASVEKIVDRHCDTRRNKDVLDDKNVIVESAYMRTLRYYAKQLSERGKLKMLDARTVVFAQDAHRVYISVLEHSAQCASCAALITDSKSKHRSFCDRDVAVAATVSDEKFVASVALKSLLKSDT